MGWCSPTYTIRWDQTSTNTTTPILELLRRVGSSSVYPCSEPSLGASEGTEARTNRYRCWQLVPRVVRLADTNTPLPLCRHVECDRVLQPTVCTLIQLTACTPTCTIREQSWPRAMPPQSSKRLKNNSPKLSLPLGPKKTMPPGPKKTERPSFMRRWPARIR